MNVNLLSITPKQTVAEQDATEGKDLFRTDPDRCCALRKVAPLAESLSSYDAWATGLRRAETHNRVIAPVIGWDAKKGKVKVSPLARWSDEQVERYIARQRRPGQPARLRRLPLDRVRPLHPPRRPRRGPAQRALGRHQQDRVRDPPVTRPRTHPDSSPRAPGEEAALMAAPALVALAPASRDPRTTKTISALVDEVKAQRPDLRVERAYLDPDGTGARWTRPELQTVVDRLVKAGHDEIVVVPLVLSEAFGGLRRPARGRRRGHRAPPRPPGARQRAPRSRGVLPRGARRAAARGPARRPLPRARRPGARRRRLHRPAGQPVGRPARPALGHPPQAARHRGVRRQRPARHRRGRARLPRPRAGATSPSPRCS